MIWIKGGFPFLFLCVYVVTPTDGFGVHPKGSLSALLSEKSRRRSSLRYQNEESPTSLAPTSTKTKSEASQEKSRNKNIDTIEIDGWDLREDWALQDSVPRYTVGTELATFWTQLRHSTPELARWSEEELEQRYKEWYNSAEDSLLVECGPSPVLLSDWRVSTAKDSAKSKQTINTIMSGSLPNGSHIWFPLKCAGTLGDEPTAASTKSPISQDALDDCFISASLAMHISGYAESTGGVVYELGAPRCETHKLYEPRSDQNVGVSSISKGVGDDDFLEDTVGYMDRIHKGLVSLASRNVGALSTLVAASTLTAYLTLGYANSLIVASPSVTQDRQGNIVSASNKEDRMYILSEGREFTISEKRARAELKVGRDKRSLVMMQELLQRDEAKLEELRQEENRLEAAEWGFL